MCRKGAWIEHVPSVAYLADHSKPDCAICNKEGPTKWEDPLLHGDIDEVDVGFESIIHKETKK